MPHHPPLLRKLTNNGAGFELRPLFCSVAWGISLLFCAGADQRLPREPLVLTQVPFSVPEQSTPGDRGSFEWARVVLVEPTGEVRNLTPDFRSACDPNISFDAQKILFAGKKQADSAWRIYELDLQEKTTRPVSPEHLEARSPIYVSPLFTLDSPDPWMTVVFVGRDNIVNEVGQPLASSLYNVKFDGTELRKLTYNPNRNFDPMQMWDGRLVYSAERYPSGAGLTAPRVQLFAVHIEGADVELYGGEKGGPSQHMSCSTPSGLMVFVEPDPTAPDRAGQLAAITEQRPHVTYQRLTSDPNWRLLYPAVFETNSLLVSRRPANGGASCAVVSFDLTTRTTQVVFNSPDYDDLQAKLLKPRPRPDGHSTIVNTKLTTGTFYGLNCYDADPLLAPHLRTGMVQRVRLIEGVTHAPQTAAAKPDSRPFVTRRLLGEAPVEADGSFNVEVPADIPVLLQTLDASGMALATCGWIWVKPKESRGCIGCHQDPERIPENEYVLALRRPSNRLTLPPEQRRFVSFRQDVIPLLAASCATADCHAGSTAKLKLPSVADLTDEAALRRAYELLMAPDPAQPNQTAGALAKGVYVDPGRARTSRLVWQLFGMNTARAWDLESSQAVAAHMPPLTKEQRLKPEELRTIIQWIDLGALYAAPFSTLPPAATEQAQTQ